MIKNCIIFCYGKTYQNQWKINPTELSKIRLEKILKISSGFTTKRIKSLLSLAKSEVLSFTKEDSNKVVLKLNCKFRSKRLLAAGELEPPLVPVIVPIWIRRKSNWVVTFDAGRRLSWVAAILLAYASTGNPSGIENNKFTRDDFYKLILWLQLNNGLIRRITLYNVQENSVKFKQIVMNSPQLEQSRSFQQFIKSCQGIGDISFTLPPLPATSRSLSCRLNYTGTLTVYTPNPFESEISAILKLIEQIILK